MKLIVSPLEQYNGDVPDPRPEGVKMSPDGRCLTCCYEPAIISRHNTDLSSHRTYEHIALCKCISGEPANNYQEALASWKKSIPIYVPVASRVRNILKATLATAALLMAFSSSAYANVGFAAQEADLPFSVNTNTAVGDWTSTALSVYGEVDALMTGAGNIRLLPQPAPAGIGAFFRNDGSNTYLLMTNPGDSLGPWNSMRPLIVNDTTGTVLLDAGGNQGRVGINTSTPQAELDVEGAAQISGSMTALYYAHTSDVRLKSNVTQIPCALDKILHLRGVTFTWKKNGQPDMGIIAQEVATVFPDVVHTNEQGIRSVEYDSLVAPLIEAIRQLKENNDELRSEIANIKAALAVSTRGRRDE